jgi:hypothetical protein
VRSHRRPGAVAPVAALAVAAVLAVTGCGVPSDSRVRTVGTPPFGLLTTSTTSPTATVAPGEGFRLTLYWVGPDDAIVPGEPIDLPSNPTFQEVIDLLTEGPPSGDAEATTTTRPGTGTIAPPALRSYITENLNPEGDEVEHQAVGPLIVQSQSGLLDVLVDDRFRDESQATPTRFRLAIAQFVCTMTQFDNVDGVRIFDSRGQLTLVNLEQNPIDVGTRSNIGQCEPDGAAPRRPPTTTTSTSPPATAERTG